MFLNVDSFYGSFAATWNSKLTGCANKKKALQPEQLHTRSSVTEQVIVNLIAWLRKAGKKELIGTKVTRYYISRRRKAHGILAGTYIIT